MYFILILSPESQGDLKLPVYLTNFVPVSHACGRGAARVGGRLGGAMCPPANPAGDFT